MRFAQVTFLTFLALLSLLVCETSEGCLQGCCMALLALVFLQQMALGVPMQKLNIFETIMLDGLDLEY